LQKLNTVLYNVTKLHRKASNRNLHKAFKHCFITVGFQSWCWIPLASLEQESRIYYIIVPISVTNDLAGWFEILAVLNLCNIFERRDIGENTAVLRLFWARDVHMGCSKVISKWSFRLHCYNAKLNVSATELYSFVETYRCDIYTKTVLFERTDQCVAYQVRGDGFERMSGLVCGSFYNKTLWSERRL